MTAAAPFAAEVGNLVVALDGRAVTRDTCREVCRLLAPVRATVCDARPPHMRPGDYLEVRVGPMDWLPGRGGWCNLRLSDPLLNRYQPQVVFAAAPDPRVIAHEVGHAVMTPQGVGFSHHPDPRNLMHDPPGEAWTSDQRRAGWAIRQAYFEATPDRFRWRRPAGWEIEAQ